MSQQLHARLSAVAKLAAVAKRNRGDSDDSDSSIEARPKRRPRTNRRSIPRDDRQRERANKLNIVKRTLDSAIKFLLGQSLTHPRPLPADRFTVEEVESIIKSRCYTVHVGQVATPLWITGTEDPILVERISTGSMYCDQAPFDFSKTLGDECDANAAVRVLGDAAKKAPRRKHSSSASSASTSRRPSATPSATSRRPSAAAPAFAICDGVPACLNGHVLIRSPAASCLLCGRESDSVMSCGDTRCNSCICKHCFDAVTPNAQAALFLMPADEVLLADFELPLAMSALRHISVSNGNVVPLDARQVAGAKQARHGEAVPCDVHDCLRIDQPTRSILVKALEHVYNTAPAYDHKEELLEDFAATAAAAEAAVQAASAASGDEEAPKKRSKPAATDDDQPKKRKLAVHASEDGGPKKVKAAVAHEEDDDEETIARKKKYAALTAVMSAPCETKKKPAAVSSSDETVVAKPSSPKRKRPAAATPSASDEHKALIDKKEAYEVEIARLMSKYTKVLIAVADAEATVHREEVRAAANAARKRTIDAKKAAATTADDGGSD
jgi:hypothetical protein